MASDLDAGGLKRYDPRMDAGEFAAQGFFGPRRVMTDGDCRRFMRLWQQRSLPPPADWFKGHAASSRAFYEIGTRRAVLDPVARLLGEDVILWGATVVKRSPGQVHAWHTDIETSDPGGRTVSVWIGLEHTSQQSSLRVITRSHEFGATIQQVTHEEGKRRGDVADSDVVAWARERDPSAALIQLDMTNGDATWFDGRLWHGTQNTGRSTRTALLLQYASADTPIWTPDFSNLEFPFRFLPAPRPPCILVRGRSPRELNRIVSAPIAKGVTKPMLSTWIRTLELPLAQDATRGFKSYPIFQGPTPNVRNLSCHVSVLEPGVSPHEPHVHKEEEVLVVLDGEADLVLVSDDGSDERVERAHPGVLAYYPAHQRHTIRGTGAGRVTYLMLNWNGEPRTEDEQLETSLYAYDRIEPTWGRDGFRGARVFEGRTRHLRKLHCHVTALDPGAGYDPHADAHDVAILVLEGTLETLGARVEAPAVVFYAGGELHGMRNVGDRPARYLVFEFHRDESDSWSRNRGGSHRILRSSRRLVSRLLRRYPPLHRVVRRALRRQ